MMTLTRLNIEGYYIDPDLRLDRKDTLNGMFICLLCLYVCIVCLYVYLFICFYVYMFIFLYVYMFMCLYVNIFICL